MYRFGSVELLRGQGAVDFPAHQFADIARNAFAQSALQFFPHDIRDQFAQSLFVEHRFVVGGRTAVMVLAKFVVTSGGEVVEPGRVLANLERALGGSPPDAEAEPLPSPELPDRVRLLLQDSDGLMSPD